MTTKQYLNQVRNLDKRVNAKLDELSSLRALTEKVTASYSEKVQASTSDTFTSNVAKIVDLEKEIDAEIDRLIRLKERITKEIDSMPSNTYSALLSSRYLEGKTWEDVAEMLHYDERQIFRIHENALKEFRRINKTCQ
jgi:hypothetical protein